MPQAYSAAQALSTTIFRNRSTTLRKAKRAGNGVAPRRPRMSACHPLGAGRLAIFSPISPRSVSFADVKSTEYQPKIEECRFAEYSNRTVQRFPNGLGLTCSPKPLILQSASPFSRYSGTPQKVGNRHGVLCAEYRTLPPGGRQPTLLESIGKRRTMAGKGDPP